MSKNGIKLKPIPADPAFSTGIGHFSNANNFVLDYVMLLILFLKSVPFRKQILLDYHIETKVESSLK